MIDCSELQEHIDATKVILQNSKDKINEIGEKIQEIRANKINIEDLGMELGE